MPKLNILYECRILSNNRLKIIINGMLNISAFTFYNHISLMISLMIYFRIKKAFYMVRKE